MIPENCKCPRWCYAIDCNCKPSSHQSTEVLTKQDLFNKYFMQEPLNFGNTEERCYPISAVINMLDEYASQFKQPLIRTDNSKVIDTLQKQVEEFKQRAEDLESALIITKTSRETNKQRAETAEQQVKELEDNLYQMVGCFDIFGNKTALQNKAITEAKQALERSKK